MDPFTTVISALASTAVRAFIKGESPNRDAWASVATAVLGAMLAEVGATQTTLHNIEKRLDQARLREFNNPFAAGLELLARAAPPHRSPAEREHFLRQALGRFIDSISAAPNERAKILAYWHLALTWLLLRSLEDCKRELRCAADAGYQALVASAEIITTPPHEDLVVPEAIRRTPAATRLFNRVLGDSTRPYSAHVANDVVREMRYAAADQMSHLRSLLQAVQRARVALGVPETECVIPRCAAYVHPESNWGGSGGGPGTRASVIIDLSVGDLVRLGDVEISCHAVRLHQVENRRIIDFKLHVGLATAANELVLEFGIIGPQDLAADGTVADGLLDPLPSRWWRQYHERQQLKDVRFGPAIPSPSLAADPASFTSQERLMIAPGYAGVGWLRLTSSVDPLAIQVSPAVKPLFERTAEPLLFTHSPRLLFLINVSSGA